jgi:tetratricopeptide (TPR) repeat protein
MQSVEAWEEKVLIPTYETGMPDRNPMFLEKRVYQGSSGVVYPHPVIDKVYDEKKDREYKALFIENEYLKIMILPEIGGRIQMAYDKTNDYHFIYYNQVIKPALVGLTGPWISGGIEFNWPQHHRPSTFEPVDYTIATGEDGSKTVWVNEIEIMFHTKGMAGFTLYPGKAYLEVTGQLYNRTPFPQSFLWWANPAVQVDEDYQSVFPPDVHAVYDHGRRDVSSFPIAKGTYYKVDYSPGTDISRYQNIPVPTSYMAVDSDFNFVGGYHHGKRAGLLHVADHHISPGKKQWTWGSGEFGKMWDRQLTDEDGPYFEIMTGVYTDNQPDFSWIMPNEQRIFKQYFLPYKDIGYVKNAGKEAAVNLEVTSDGVTIKVYVTSVQKGTRIILRQDADVLLDDGADLSPAKAYSREIALSGVDKADLVLEVKDEKGKLLISYHPVAGEEKVIPDPAMAMGDPRELATCEDLFLAGLHLEQYRHATYSPVAYYSEALRRDPSDIRSNNALGLWYLKHGRFAEAEPFFHHAIAKLIRHNPNPYNGEPYYNLGLCLCYQQRWEEAYDSFYKACWNAAWQDNGYLQLACIDCRRGDMDKALENLEQSLGRNYHGMKARHLKAVVLRKLGKYNAAEKWITDTLAIDRFDFGSLFERSLVLEEKGQRLEAASVKQQLQSLTRGWTHSYIEIAIDYANAGQYDDAITLLSLPGGQDRHREGIMLYYYRAFYFSMAGRTEEMSAALQEAAGLSVERVFPNRLEDIGVLQLAVEKIPEDYKAYYSLGNLWYDKRQYEQATACWEKAAALRDDFPTAHRNLGIAYYNKFKQAEKSLSHYEKAFAADPTDARVLFELDQLKRCMNAPLQERLRFLDQHFVLVGERDDLYIAYVTLHNLLGQYEHAERLLQERHFHPWEGGEGKVSRQYVQTKVALARKALQDNDAHFAIRLLEKAGCYPENLGEGKLYGAQENDIFYWQGCAYAEDGDQEQATCSWQKASEGLSEPAPAIYYNDQPPETIFYQGMALRKLDREKEAEQRFDNLIRYGEAHLDDEIKIDFFAVSLPDLMVFDTDLNARNRMHCHYLMALGYMGSGNKKMAEEHFDQVLQMDASHQGAVTHLGLLKEEGSDG